MQQDADVRAWRDFYGLVGRYVVAAGNAESNMFLLLLALERHNGTCATRAAPQWAGLVQRIRAEAAPTTYSERVQELLNGALRRGRIRNHIVHTSWQSVGDEAYSGRRHSRKEGSALFFLNRNDLTESMRTMEWFRDELWRVAAQVSAARVRA